MSFELLGEIDLGNGIWSLGQDWRFSIKMIHEMRIMKRMNIYNKIHIFLQRVNQHVNNFQKKTPMK